MADIGGPGHHLSEQNPAFKLLLDTFADRDDLTFVLGAGTSADAGLPNWLAAVQAILVKGMQDDEDLSDQAKDLARELTRSSSTTECATIARLLLGNETNRVVHGALYGKHVGSVRPGWVTQKVAQLAASYRAATVVTTNWDDLIEWAFEDNQVPSSAVVSGKLSSSAPNAQLVYHVHGFVPQQGAVMGPIVLDERDYALLPPDALTPLHEALESDGVLLVGMGMTDPNVVRAAYRTAKKRTPGNPERFGLFAASVGDGLHSDIRALSLRRLHDQGIQPVDLRHYGQVAHTIAELLNRRQFGADSYWKEQKYGFRLERWRSEILKKWPSQGGKFGDTQGALHDALNSGLREKIDSLVGGLLASGEHLGLHIWARTVTPVGIELWAASSQCYKEQWALPQPEEIRPDSGYPAVESIFNGTVLRRDISQLPSRWNYVISVPIVLVEEPWYHLTVGVVTLSSTESRKRSGLAQAGSETVEALNEIGFDLLDPS